MHRVTLDKLPVSASTRHTLQNTPAVAGAVVSDDPEDGEVCVRVFGPALQFKSLEEARRGLANIVCAWERDAEPKPAARADGLSRTAAALKLIDEEDITPYAAAQQCGISTSAVYRALARRERPKCQCCGRPLPAAREIES